MLETTTSSAPVPAETQQTPVRRGHIIAIGNLKGGTGKSTLAVNLACALQVMQHQSIVVDADPQLTATQWMARRRLPARIHEAPVRDLEAAPTFLAELGRFQRSNDFVIIDLPAVLTTAMASSFYAADLIIVPSWISQVDLAATRRTLRHIDKVRRERSNAPPATLIVPMRINKGWLGDGGVKRAFGRMPAPVARAVRADRAFHEAFAAADWIGGYAPRSAGYYDIMTIARRVVRLTKGR